LTLALAGGALRVLVGGWVHLRIFL